MTYKTVFNTNSLLRELTNLIENTYSLLVPELTHILLETKSEGSRKEQ